MGGLKTMGKIHGEAFRFVTKNYVPMLLIALIMWGVELLLETVTSVITAPLGMLSSLFALPMQFIGNPNDPWSYIPVITAALSAAGIGILVSVAIGFALKIVQHTAEIGGKNATLQLLAGQKPTFDGVWKNFAKNWKRYLGISAWAMLWTVLWGLLLIIPGYVKSLGYRFAPYLMLQYPDMNARDALKKSMEITDGYKGRLFGLDLILVGYGAAMVLLCCLMLPLLGFLLWLPPMAFAMYSIAYLDIKKAAADRGLLPPDPLPRAGEAAVAVEQAS